MGAPAAARPAASARFLAPPDAPPRAPSASLPAEWQSGFLALLPEIRRRASRTFRHLSAEAKEEAVQDVVCDACLAYRRLHELGKAEVATAVALAGYAAAHHRSGRRVGQRMNANDPCSDYCRIRRGLRVARWGEGGWEEALVEDRTVTPADLAASRIDYPAWLDSLPCRDRRVAEALAAGERSGVVARAFGLSAARVSQLRRELLAAWHRFHGHEAAGPALAAA